MESNCQPLTRCRPGCWLDGKNFLKALIERFKAIFILLSQLTRKAEKYFFDQRKR
jgi:hypothetical protein